ncbi:hypothetical protein HMPREF1981_03413 [Bacteroides pyogenes F0041]|uniref:Uncharacterized protein n=1 Tax=Bacteroides pyogenes F0041 TaxID=1321819 RepID=U2C910_9BACE|nr:hypothetical protein HMPREF1981_03413 [Bacteroides pyogenes F0041]
MTGKDVSLSFVSRSSRIQSPFRLKKISRLPEKDFVSRQTRSLFQA